MPPDDPRHIPSRKEFRADPRGAWNVFLEDWAELLYRVAGHQERDADNRSECFVYICERLAQDGFKKLLKFKLAGGATFATWLTVVSRNLAVDWHRKKRGRPSDFQFVEKLPAAQQLLFRMVFRERKTLLEAQRELRMRGYECSEDELELATARISQQMDARQQWTLAVQGGNDVLSNALGSETEFEFRNAARDPEEATADREMESLLAKGFGRLSKKHRLALTMRFRQDLTFQEMAKLLHLGNAQAADRLLREAVQELRGCMSPEHPTPNSGKVKAKSV